MQSLGRQPLLVAADTVIAPTTASLVENLKQTHPFYLYTYQGLELQ